MENASWVFGGLVLVFIMGVVGYRLVTGNKPVDHATNNMLGFLCAILAGLFAFFFTGTIAAQIASDNSVVRGIAIQATGGVALFVVVLWWWRSGANNLISVSSVGPDPGLAALSDVLSSINSILGQMLKKLDEQSSPDEDQTRNIRQKELIKVAQAAVEQTANHTRYYISNRRTGNRDRNTEIELSDKWLKVGNCLSNLDSPAARELHEICFLKARYWSNTDGWDDIYDGKGKDITLRSVVDKVHKLTLQPV